MSQNDPQCPHYRTTVACFGAEISCLVVRAQAASWFLSASAARSCQLLSCCGLTWQSLMDGEKEHTQCATAKPMFTLTVHVFLDLMFCENSEEQFKKWNSRIIIQNCPDHHTLNFQSDEHLALICFHTMSSLPMLEPNESVVTATKTAWLQTILKHIESLEIIATPKSQLDSLNSNFSVFEPPKELLCCC